MCHHGAASILGRKPSPQMRKTRNAGMRGLFYSHLNTFTRGITVPGAEGDIHTVARAFLQRYTGSSQGQSSHASHPVRNFPSAVRIPVQRTLQQYLENGEYPLFQSFAMFESSFIQVTRKGKQVFIHNNSNKAIVGIATSNPKLPLPNLMFIARPGVGRVSSGQHREELMLTRLIPLKFVRISIHDSKKQLIKIKLINRRSYYLQLYSSAEDAKALFDCWLSLISLLHHPPRSYLGPYFKPCKIRESHSVQIIPSEIESEIDTNVEDEDKMDSIPVEKKATRAKLQSQDSITKETYSKSEDYIIRMRPRLLSISGRSVGSHLESFESFYPSQPETPQRYSTLFRDISEYSDLTLSRCSMPAVHFSEKGESGVEIITVYSVFSEHANTGESSES